MIGAGAAIADDTGLEGPIKVGAACWISAECSPSRGIQREHVEQRLIVVVGESGGDISGIEGDGCREGLPIPDGARGLGKGRAIYRSSERPDDDELRTLMEEAFKLEETIRSGDDLDDAVIEAKGALKKLMTGDEVTELLEGLEMGGEPVWGLSTKERHLVREAKEKIHAV